MHPDWSRYSCQMVLPGFDETAQQRLQQARVLIVGAGGLGCPAAQYLAASGTGTLGIADFDTVSVSNLHRQILYNHADVGLLKAQVATERLQKQNPGIKVVAHIDKVTSYNITQLIENYDIIIDCTDNFDTRYLLNDAGVIFGKPVVYGAIYQFEGQVAVWNILNKDGNRTPNYRDLFPRVNAAQIPNCVEGGVIPTLAGIIGCMQANEVIKCITKVGDLLAGRMLVFDALTMQSRVIKVGSTTRTYITSIQQTGPIQTISSVELQQRLTDSSLQLIDVRTLQEREVFNIGGRHIPMDELLNNLNEFNTGKTFVIYCASGIRSAGAVKLILERLPEAKVLSLAGGLKQFQVFVS